MKLNKPSRRDFIKSVAVAGSSLAFAGGLKAQTADNGVSGFITREADKLKFLGITDVHFFDTKHKELYPHTIASIKAMIEKFNPELLVITGDLWFEDFLGQGFNHCKWVVKQMEDLNIPWAFCWGNHDASADHKKCHPIFTGAKNSLYKGTLYDGNYRVEIKSPGAQKPFWNFVVVNDAMPDKGFAQPQIKWFNEEAARIKAQDPNPAPAFVFAHIPIPQLRDVWDKKLAVGVQEEPKGNQGGVYYEGGIRGSFDAFKNSGIVKGFFCGHDHMNNFWGTLDGIHLQYLRATGYSGYGGDKVKKGGTIINIDATGAEKKFEVMTVFEDGTIWDPPKQTK
jgi:3',5'-cyclic AMP phosphodiesterase CpdA